MQGLTLNYSRTEGIRTRIVIQNALIRVLQAGMRKKTDWNVELVMEEQSTKAEHSTKDESRPLRRTYRSRRKVEGKK